MVSLFFNYDRWNNKLQRKIQKFVAENKIEEAISYSEKLLSKEKKTDFHFIIGKDLLHLRDELEKWLLDFYKIVTKEFFGKNRGKIGAIYCEITEVTNANNSVQTIADAFAYKKKREGNWDWLAHWDNKKNIKPFVIKGLPEELEKVSKNNSVSNQEDVLKKSSDLCFILLLLRKLELFMKTYNTIKKGGSDLGKVPLLVSEHDINTILEMN